MKGAKCCECGGKGSGVDEIPFCLRCNRRRYLEWVVLFNRIVKRRGLPRELCVLLQGYFKRTVSVWCEMVCTKNWIVPGFWLSHTPTCADCTFRDMHRLRGITANKIDEMWWAEDILSLHGCE